MSKIIKFALLLLGALLIALIVRTVIAGAYHTSAPTVTTQKVRVSAADLPQGLLLRDDDLGWKNVPVAEVPPNAIVADAPNAVDLKGALLRRPAASGTVLVADDVILPNAPGFLAATLKPEMRAVSVAVDDVSGNAGLIQPGDYVDLMLTQQMDRRTESPDLAVATETVVQHVRVLAVGSEISRPKTSDAPDANNRARTVTLEVTPRMGEVVSVAARLGSLSLALRSFATASRDPDSSAAASASSASQAAPVWAGDISRALRELPKSRAQQVSPVGLPPVPAAPRTVMIYRGSESSNSAEAVAQGNGGAANGVPPLPTVPASH
ncbi:pilus assembly protein CpaB [Burkholderia sp. D7]|nr:pilus assembly protein CpaB [Burkholderia sp. D7]